MKILYVTTIGITMNFFKTFIKRLLDEGNTVDIATNEKDTKVADCYYKWGCRVYQIDCSRSPLKKGNIDAIKQIAKIVEDTHYDIVHCHTPIAAACTRLACRTARRKGTKVFYTAHGFHFYKGAPLQNWLIFYPIEKICSYFTDVLITINKEDYMLAQKRMRAKKIAYIPGVGIDLKKFCSEKMSLEKVSKKRCELGIPKEAVLLLSVGELNENKNHETVIHALHSLVKLQNKTIYYIIAGTGYLKDHLQSVINEAGLNNYVYLLGYRRDIAELCQVADVFVFPSYREGLSVSVMEAMASGLPVVCSKIRGNVDLIDEVIYQENTCDTKGKNRILNIGGGTLFEPDSVKECVNALQKMISIDRETVGQYNRTKIQKFELETVNAKLMDLYDMKS